MGLNFVPYVGTAKGVLEAIVGHDLLTGQELTTTDRLLGLIPGGRAGRLGRVDDVFDASRLGPRALPPPPRRPELPPPPRRPELPPPPPPHGRRAIEPPPRPRELEAAPPRHIPGGGLDAHENLPTLSGNSAGHTLARHVGRTDAQLAQRLADQPNLQRVSTFASRSEANHWVDQAILANRDDIDTWLSNPASGNRISFEVDFGPNAEIGRVMERGATTSSPGRGVNVVLERRPPGADPPYLIVTSYPTPGM